jgi:hypothetical protein
MPLILRDQIDAVAANGRLVVRFCGGDIARGMRQRPDKPSFALAPRVGARP